MMLKVKVDHVTVVVTPKILITFLNADLDDDE